MAVTTKKENDQEIREPKEKREKRQRKPRVSDEKRFNYIMARTAMGLILLAAVIVCSVTVIVNARLRLTERQLYETNRVRVETVLSGLQAGVTEKDELYDEYDKVFLAKLKGTSYLYSDFDNMTFNARLA